MLTLCRTTLFSTSGRIFAARPLILSLLLAATLGLGACGSLPKGEASYPTGQDDANSKRYGKLGDNVDGDSSFTLFDSGKNKRNGGNALGVNGYLWRSALDTVQFMPILSADSNGGTILTDWYSPSATPNERLKLNIIIKDQTLRADGVKVTVFKQKADGKGNWRDMPVNPDTATKLEDQIVQNARQLRLAADGKQ